LIGGELKIQSFPGKGTNITVFIPAASETDASESGSHSGL